MQLSILESVIWVAHIKTESNSTLGVLLEQHWYSTI